MVAIKLLNARITPISLSGSNAICSTSFKSSVALPKRACCRLLTIVRAEQKPEDPKASPSDEEARLEALEASLRSKKGANAAAASSSRQSSSSASSSPFAEWKEGELFPEGWDKMDPLQKIAELYLGQRGFLFWSTKLATGGVIALAVAWAVFRFVGPALGLYQLANDISTPNF